MRSGYKQSLLSNEHGAVCAINLGADYVSEHEWGIEGIRLKLSILNGLAEDNKGLDRHLVRTENFENLHLFEDGDRTYLALYTLRSWNGEPAVLKRDEHPLDKCSPRLAFGTEVKRKKGEPRRLPDQIIVTIVSGKDKIETVI